MSTYICEKCGCIDNTACGGNYWAVSYSISKFKKDGTAIKKCFKDEYANTHVLCVECTPAEYSDGSIKREAGKWHNMFLKKHWSEYGTKEKLIADCKRNNGSVVNAIEYFNDNL